LHAIKERQALLCQDAILLKPKAAQFLVEKLKPEANMSQ